MFLTRTSDPTPAHNAIDTLERSSLSQTLFRHTRREQWGLGIICRKLDDRVKMQFQDGRTRTFKTGYYHLLDVVDRPMDVTLSVIRALESMSDDLERTADDRRQPVSMDEQLAYFRERFEGGFRDPEYVTYHRGTGRKRPLKRHRDALVETAAKLSQAEMRRKIAEGDFSGVHAAATAVVKLSDLVKAKERRRFAEIDAEHHERFALSLNALLFGKSKLAVRFDAYVRSLETALGRNPSWGLATILLGATRPKDFVVVREKVLGLQARWMAPGLAVPEHPMGLLYERLNQMTMGVQERLVSAGLAPRDLLDVTDFMWATLRPKAQERIDAMRLERELMAPTQSTAATDEVATEAA